MESGRKAGESWSFAALAWLVNPKALRCCSYFLALSCHPTAPVGRNKNGNTVHVWRRVPELESSPQSDATHGPSSPRASFLPKLSTVCQLLGIQRQSKTPEIDTCLTICEVRIPWLPEVLHILPLIFHCNFRARGPLGYQKLMHAPTEDV